MRKTEAEILANIAAAFASAKMPRSEDEITTGGIDGPYVVKHFLGKSRAEVATSFMPSLHMEDFTYMTKQAVDYYLPVVLELMMKQPYDDELWIYLRSFLANGRARAYPTAAGELSREALQAIAEWATYLHGEWAASPPLLIDPNEALELANAYRA